jgi:two-component system nitrogen regulation response regulator GlnG
MRRLGPTADIIGEAPAMQDVFRIIGRLSRSSISVLINGESGTGKELVAHACIATARGQKRRLSP